MLVHSLPKWEGSSGSVEENASTLMQQAFLHYLMPTKMGEDQRAIAPLTRTTFWRGAYDTNPDLQAEFFTVCGVHP